MVGGLKMTKILPYSCLLNPNCKLEWLRAEIYLVVTLQVPAGKFSGTRGVQQDLACLEWYRI